MTPTPRARQYILGPVMASIQAEGIEEFEDYIRVPMSITPSGFRIAEGGKRVYRPEDELDAMAEMMNGLPIFIGPEHPPLDDIVKMTGLNVADPDHPTAGVMQDVRSVVLEDGRHLVQGYGKFFRKDRAGNDRADDLAAIKRGDLKNVSPGMFTHFVPEKGTDPQGNKYDFIEWGTKPTHVQVLTIAPPDCKPPTCQVHGAAMSCSCLPRRKNGDDDLTEGDQTPPKGEGPAPEATTQGAAPPANVTVNVNGAAPVATPAAPAAQSAEDETPGTPPATEGDGNTTLDDKERVELEELRKAKEEAAKAERDKKVKAITEGLGEEAMKEYFPDGIPEDMCCKDLERWGKMADGLMAAKAEDGDEDNAAEPAPPAAPEPAPAAQSSEKGKSFMGLKLKPTSQSTDATKPKGMLEAIEYKPPVGPGQ